MKHVLLITMGYPSIYSPIRGIFFKDQAEALVSSGMKVGLLALNPISLSDTIQKKKMDFGTRTLNCMGVKTIVYQFQNVPKWYNYRVLKSKNKGFSLFEKYMSEHGKPDIQKKLAGIDKPFTHQSDYHKKTISIKYINTIKIKCTKKI